MIWICVTYPAFIIVNSFRKTFEKMMCQNLSYLILSYFVFVCVMVNAFVIKFIVIRKLRWSETVPVLSKTYSLMGGHYNHSLSVNDTVMVSTNCPIIGEQVAVNFAAQ